MLQNDTDLSVVQLCDTTVTSNYMNPGYFTLAAIDLKP